MVVSPKEILADSKNNNFNFIRLLAAVFVVLTHSYTILGFSDHDLLSRVSNGLFSFSRLGVYVFFIASGFLIAQSLESSSSVISFFWKRFLRIVPALSVVIFLTVFVLGPMVTDLRLADYFQTGETYRYLMGVMIYPIRFDLPGVFLDNFRAGMVNGALWTLPYECTCYFLLSLFLVFGKKRNKIVLLVSFLALLILRFYLNGSLGSDIPIILLRTNHLLNYGLFFLSGSVAYAYREYLVFKPWIAMVASGLIIVGFNFSWGIYCLYALLVYLVLYFAIVRLPWNKFFIGRDYSYGLYIYAFPIQQVLSKYFHQYLHVWSLVVVTLLCTMPLAIASWYWIEKPSLKLKNLVK